MKGKRKVRVVCKHCGYEWKTQSRALYVTCPNCQRKTIRKRFENIL